MAVYREGFSILEKYGNEKHQIWNDSCDEGVAVSKDDSNWNVFKQLVEWYGDPSTRKCDKEVGIVSEVVTLIDEWAVSDERKTVEEATEEYLVTFYKLGKGGYFGKSNLIKQDCTYGFFNIERVK